MNKYIDAILNKNIENIEKTLQEYTEKVSQKYEFPELDVGNNRKEIWNTLYKIISSSKESSLHVSCFTLCRILSREKKDLNEIINDDWLNIFKYHACFTKEKLLEANDNKMVAIEALKAFYNIIFNSSVAIAITTRNGTLEDIFQRLKIKNTLDMNVKMFDMKILFLITALCPEVQFKVKNDMNGLKYLLQDLQSIISKTNFNHNADKKEYSETLTDMEVDFCCEVLKVFFNLTLTWNLNENVEEEEEKYCVELVVILRQLLLIPVMHEQKKFELHNNTANLITNIPDKYLLSLKLNEQMLVTNDKDFAALNTLLDLLKKKFELELTVKQQHDVLSPILTVFFKLANSNKFFRKYLRKKILPPLRDVHTRPEQGNTLRNYLCKLLTSPITQVRDLSAELLFKLCKENVGRMIKYTGYGNAAGMFANRGLLGGQNTSNTSDSDTSDSETEEYNEYKHGINPVIGCYEVPKSNPLDGMSEEQKEYEVMKLVKLMDDMTRQGIVKPCKIGDDGKPQPIEHVLQLQEGLPAQQIRQNNDDSD